MKISCSLFCLAKDRFFALILSAGFISFSQMAFAQTPDAWYNLTRAESLPATNHHDQTIKWIVP
jgi:hypothetical protein